MFRIGSVVPDTTSYKQLNTYIILVYLDKF